MRKKSQITVFIIIGLLLLIIVALLLMFQNAWIKIDQGLTDDYLESFSDVGDKTDLYVVDCLERITEDAIERLWVSNAHLIELYLDHNFLECIDEFEPIEEEGFNITHETPSFDATVFEDRVSVDMIYPITIMRDDQTLTIEQFNAVVDVDPSWVEDGVIRNFADIRGFDMVFRNVAYRREHREDPRNHTFFVVKVNLNDYETEFLVTPLQSGLQRTSSFLRENDLQVAINGGGWPRDGSYRTTADVPGPVYSRGTEVSQGFEYSTTVSIEEDHDTFIRTAPTDHYNVITGFNALVENGDVYYRLFPDNPGYKIGYDYLQPRTSIGYDEDRHVLVFVVVDGRQSGYSDGVNLRELARLQLEHGVDIAVNMDGGGSTTLAMEGSGVVNSPSAGERAVATHLGVKAYPYPIVG